MCDFGTAHGSDKIYDPLLQLELFQVNSSQTTYCLI